MERPFNLALEKKRGGYI